VHPSLRALYDDAKGRLSIPVKAGMSQIKSGYDALRIVRRGGKRDRLTIHPETGQRISTTALENGATLEDVRRTVRHADLLTRWLHDSRWFMPMKAAALVVDNGKMRDVPRCVVWQPIWQTSEREAINRAYAAAQRGDGAGWGLCILCGRVLIVGQSEGLAGHPGDHLNPTHRPYHHVKHGALESAPGLMTVAER
jgi:hypothetical protein